ncbi:hypothetical protein LCGC14_1861810 [marine sediment metagenome]|uniref:Uncharacterized protein n=1 Tax=marine sediment metagenome TaxID=412755 RepID=A0A0F9J697_9ZZZZ
MCLKCHVYADGSHTMTQEKAKKAWRVVYLVLDKKMTTEQASDLVLFLQDRIGTMEAGAAERAKEAAKHNA